MVTLFNPVQLNRLFLANLYSKESIVYHEIIIIIVNGKEGEPTDI